METSDTTAIQGVWSDAGSAWSIGNSLDALNGVSAIIAVSIVVGLVFVLAKRITKRLSKAKGGM